jgi:hypothetical protein
MPTPKFTPGAQLIPLSFSNPAFQGLNTELGGNILPQVWATVLDNAVYDETGRPASRRGWRTLTTTPGIGIVKRIFEHYKADKTSEVLFTTDADVFKTVTNPSSLEGSLTITDGNIKFANFNDKCIAFGIGTGGIPTVRTSGSFADISVSDGGTLPTSGIGMSAFGRVWGVMADGKTIRYSNLLDETQWATASGAGSIDMSKVWPAGQDAIIAIEEFAGDLIVFGTNNTVVFTDGQGSALGIDPLAMYVSDTIPGVGAVSQFAIARAAGDLWVLTRSGVISLNRERAQKTTPFTNISKNVQSGVVGAIASTANADDITMEYSPKQSMVLLHFPDTDLSYAFDTRGKLEDGSFRCSTWTSNLQTLHYIRAADNFYGSLTGVVGEIMKYDYSDDNGTAFVFDYESGWLDLGEELNVYLKFVKRMTSFVFVTQNVVVTHKIKYDFKNTQHSVNVNAGGGRVAEYGRDASPIIKYAEYGASGSYDLNDPLAVAGTDIAEFGGGVALRTLDAPGRGGGQYIKIGLRLDNQTGDFVLQQINLFAKVGRIAT